MSLSPSQYPIETRLEELARRTGRSMSSYARRRSSRRSANSKRGSVPGDTFSLDEVERLVRSQAPGGVIHREGQRIIVEKPAVAGLTEWLRTLEPLDEEFPDVDTGIPPLDQPDIADDARWAERAMASHLRFMLDTNIVSDLVRNPLGQGGERIERLGAEMVCVSIIVAAELRYGAMKGKSVRIVEWVDGVLERLPVLPLDLPADADYATIRAQLEGAGTPMGANDLLIAAHACALRWPS